jgi:C-methyltransferase
MYYACLHWSAEHLNAWQEMAWTVQTGRSSFEMIYNEPFFDYIGKRPEKLDAYHKAMYAYALDDYAHIADHLPLAGMNSVLDVGGGYGALISQVKKGFPRLRCALYDLPKVAANVSFSGVETIGGNFFESIPAGFDCIIMSRVLHDWNDEACRKILLNAMEALDTNGRLVLIENLSDRVKDKTSALTLNMLAICNSYERMEAGYIRLLTEAGFAFGSSARLNSLQYILTARKP